MKRQERRDADLLSILKTSGLTNEQGHAWTSFQTQGRDSLDFGSISIGQLQSLLAQAYQAGAVHAATFKGLTPDGARAVFLPGSK